MLIQVPVNSVKPKEGSYQYDEKEQKIQVGIDLVFFFNLRFFLIGGKNGFFIIGVQVLLVKVKFQLSELVLQIQFCNGF